MTNAPCGDVHSATWLAGQVIVGGVVSRTRTVAESLSLSPPVSLTVSSTEHARGLSSDAVGTLSTGVAEVGSLNEGEGHVLVQA